MEICKIVKLTQIAEKKQSLNSKGMAIDDFDVTGNIINQGEKLIYSNDMLGLTIKFPVYWELHDKNMIKDLIKPTKDRMVILEKQKRRKLILNSINNQQDVFLLHGKLKVSELENFFPFINIYTVKDKSYLREPNEYAKELLDKFNFINSRYKIKKVNEINPYVIKGKRFKKIYVILTNSKNNLPIIINYYFIRIGEITLAINTCYQSIEQEKIFKEVIDSISIKQRINFAD